MSHIDRYYKILGLKLDAPPEEVKQAYRQLVKIWHPDRFIDNPEKQKEAEEKFKEIVKAYQQILDYQSSKTQFNSSFSSEIITKPIAIKSFYKQGIEFAASQKYTEAIEAFTQAIRLNPYYVDAYQYRGFVLAKLGYEYRSRADFKKAAELKLQSQEISKDYPSENYSSGALWKCKKTIRGNFLIISRIVPISKNQIFASTSSSSDNSIKLWQLYPERSIANFPSNSNPIRCLDLSLDGRFLVSGSTDKTIKLWEVNTKKLIRTFGGWFSGHKDNVEAVAISPNGERLISGSTDRTVKIWELNTGKELYTLTGFSAPVLSISISLNGEIFVTGGLEQHLRVWSASNGKLIRSLRSNSGALSVSLSPNAKILAAGGFNRKIGLWDLNTGKEFLTLPGHIDGVSCLTFSGDGQTLISGSWDKTIKIWQLDTGKEVCTLNEHLDKVTSVAIAPDGKTIISGSADNTIKVWQQK